MPPTKKPRVGGDAGDAASPAGDKDIPRDETRSRAARSVLNLPEMTDLIHSKSIMSPQDMRHMTVMLGAAAPRPETYFSKFNLEELVFRKWDLKYFPRNKREAPAATARRIIHGAIAIGLHNKTFHPQDVVVALSHGLFEWTIVDHPWTISEARAIIRVSNTKPDDILKTVDRIMKGKITEEVKEGDRHGPIFRTGPILMSLAMAAYHGDLGSIRWMHAIKKFKINAFRKNTIHMKLPFVDTIVTLDPYCPIIALASRHIGVLEWITTLEDYNAGAPIFSSRRAVVETIARVCFDDNIGSLKYLLSTMHITDGIDCVDRCAILREIIAVFNETVEHAIKTLRFTNDDLYDVLERSDEHGQIAHVFYSERQSARFADCLRVNMDEPIVLPISRDDLCTIVYADNIDMLLWIKEHDSDVLHFEYWLELNELMEALAVHYPSTQSKRETLDCLLEYMAEDPGALFNIKEYQMMNMITACYHGNMVFVRAMLRLHDDPVKYSNPLLMAATSLSDPAAFAFLRRHYKIQKSRTLGFPYLQDACRYGNLETAKAIHAWCGVKQGDVDKLLDAMQDDKMYTFLVSVRDKISIPNFVTWGRIRELFCVLHLDRNPVDRTHIDKRAKVVDWLHTLKE